MTGAWLVVIAFVMALLPMVANAAGLPAPALLTPTANTTVDQPVFTWSAVAGADHYEIEVALDDQFVTVTDPPLPQDPGEVGEPRPVFGTTYIPRFTYSAKTHYWHVRAIGPDETEGPWSASRVFTRRWTNEDEPSGTEQETPASRVDDVRLVTGGTSTAVNDVAVTWDPVPGAAYYQVQIGSGNSDHGLTCTTPHNILMPPFAGGYVRRAPLDTCSSLLSPYHSWVDGAAWAQSGPGQMEIETQDGAPGDLWYVRFLNAGGTDVVIDPFLTEVETAGGDPRTVTVSGPVPGDLAAQVQYYELGLPIDAGGTYSVRVRAVDFTVDPDYPAITTSPVYGMWSDEPREPGEAPPTFTFDVTAPRAGTGSADEPVIPVDLNMSDTDVPVLSWEPVPDAVAYEVTIALDRDFTNRVAEYTTRNTALVPPETYDDNGPAGTYYWFATPCTSDDAASEIFECTVPDRKAINNPSYVGRFSKQSEPVQNLSRALADDQTNVRVDWGDALTAAQSVDDSYTPGGVEKYQVQFTDGPWSQASSFLTDNLAYSTSLEPLQPGDYRWRVRPFDGQGVALAWAYGPDFTIAGSEDEPSPSPSPTPTPTPSESHSSPGPVTSPGATPVSTPVYQAPAPAQGTAQGIPPDPPGKPTVRRATKRKLRVHWRASEELGEPVSAYFVYRSTNGTAFKKVRTTTSQTVRVKAKRGRTYLFYVVADSEAGRSEPSGTRKFTMPRRR